MLPPTLVPMKTTTMGNSSPCHSHSSHVGEMTIATMHPPHERQPWGEKHSPHAWLLAMKSWKLGTWNFKLCWWWWQFIVVVINYYCYWKIREGESERGKTKNKKKKTKKKKQRGPYDINKAFFQRCLLFFFHTFSLFQGLLLQRLFFDFCSCSKYRSLIVVQLCKEWHKENNNTKQKLKPTPHNV